jgi:hypothetical protein
MTTDSGKWVVSASSIEMPLTRTLIKWPGTKKLLNPRPADKMPRIISTKFMIRLLDCMVKYSSNFPSSPAILQ